MVSCSTRHEAKDCNADPLGIQKYAGVLESPSADKEGVLLSQMLPGAAQRTHREETVKAAIEKKVRSKKVTVTCNARPCDEEIMSSRVRCASSRPREHESTRACTRRHEWGQAGAGVRGHQLRRRSADARVR